MLFFYFQRLLAKLLLNSNPAASFGTEKVLSHDEHSLIANYSQLLAEFYAKNPHLASTSSPSTPDQLAPASSSQKLKPNLKSKVTTICDTYSSIHKTNSQYIDSSLQRLSSRTSSLQRQSGVERHRLAAKSPMSHQYVTASGSSSYINGSANTLGKNYANAYYRNGQAQLASSSLQPITTRSISESNFRTNTGMYLLYGITYFD